MEKNNFTNQLHQHMQSHHSSEPPQVQGFTEGYMQAVLNFKEIMEEYDRKGYKSLKEHLWEKIKKDMISSEAIMTCSQDLNAIHSATNNASEKIHVKFVWDPTGTLQHSFDTIMSFAPTTGQKMYRSEWSDEPFVITDIFLAFNGDGIFDFDGYVVFLEQSKI